MSTMNEILKETEGLMAIKEAALKGRPVTKRALAGQSPDSMPGSEHDTTIPEGSTSPDKEVADSSMGPASTRTVSGAGDDSPVTRGHAVDATKSVQEPTQKPLITADANAKQAQLAKLANDIAADVVAYNKLRTQPTKVAAAPAPAPARAPAAPAAPVVKQSAPAASPGLQLELTQGVLAKMAAVMLSFEEGAKAMSDAITKFGGTELHDQIFGPNGLIAEQSEAANEAMAKQAAAVRGYEDGLAAIAQHLAQQTKVAAAPAPVAPAAPAAPAPTVEKLAADRVAALVKLGQEMAGASIEDMMGALPNEAGAPQGDPMGAAPEGEGFTLEDLTAALDMMVSQGKLQPEEAQAVMEFVVSGGGEAGLGAGAAPGGAPAEGMPAAPGAGEPPMAPEGAGAPPAAPAEGGDKAAKKEDKAEDKGGDKAEDKGGDKGGDKAKC